MSHRIAKFAISAVLLFFKLNDTKKKLEQTLFVAFCETEAIVIVFLLRKRFFYITKNKKKQKQKHYNWISFGLV